MADLSNNVPPPERDSLDKVRARLRAAGLYKDLDQPAPKPLVKVRPRDDVVVPFRRLDDFRKSNELTARRRKFAGAIYLILLAGSLLLVWH